MTYRHRQELHDALLAAFCAEPEIHGIYVFGREVDGKTDGYSDIDMVVCSDDPPGTYDRLRTTLAQIAPIVGSHLIHADTTNVAEMFLLGGFSPYQKIDLSVSGDLDAKAAFAPFRSLYQRPRHTASPITAPMPDLSHIRNSLTNRLHDLLFSIPRFTKCLFRGERDMYRRWVGITEAMATVLHESYFGWSLEPRGRLLPHEYKRLFSHLTEADRNRMDRIHPLTAQPDLCHGFSVAMNWIVDLYKLKAAQTQQPLETRVAEYLLPFLEQEIRRFRQDSCMSITSNHRAGMIRPLCDSPSV